MNGTAAKASLRLKGSGDEQITVTGRRTPLRCALLPKKLRSTSSMKTTTSPSSTSRGHDGACGRGSHRRCRNRGTLVNALLHHFGTLSAIGGELRPGIVHRLDRATSGLMVVAKNDESHRRLAKQFSSREVHKTYLALVHGWPKQDRGTIQSPISRHSQKRTRMTTKGFGGRDAVTHYVVKRKLDAPYGKFALVELKIETDARTRFAFTCRRLASGGGRRALRRAGRVAVAVE